MDTNWFFSLYFRPRNNMLPELIDKDGNRTRLENLGKKQIMEVIKQSFLLNIQEPTIFYNGTHQIEHLDKLIISKKHKEVLQKNLVKVYFFEPLTHYIKNNTNHMQSHTLKINNNPDEIANLYAYELDSLQEWAVKNQISNLQVYCTDWKCHEHYQSKYPALKLLIMDVFVAWWAQRYTFQENRSSLGKGWYHDCDSSLITKKFWSGAWRYEPYRHFLTSFLVSRGLHKKNNVSFYFKISNEELKRRMWFNWDEFSSKHPSLSQSVIEGNNKLQDVVPLSFACDNVVALGDQGSDPNYSSKDSNYNIRTSHDPEETYVESFCAIVQESRFGQPWPNISEKTLNAIRNYRPFVLAGPPGTLKMLKELGFKTFDAYWPEDYDNIIDNTERLVKICETIDYINSFSIEDLIEMHKDMESILIYNKENIKNIVQHYDDLNNTILKTSH